jgi:hypothetical protein
VSENQPSWPGTPPSPPDPASVVPPTVYAHPHPPAPAAQPPAQGGQPALHGGWSAPQGAQPGLHGGQPASQGGGWSASQGGRPVTVAAQLAPHVAPGYGRPPAGYVPSPGRPPSGLFPGPSRPIFREPHPVAAAPVLAGFGAALLWFALFGGLAHDLAAYAWWTIVAAITAWAVALVLTVLGDRGAAVGVALASGLGLSIAMAFVGTRWIDTYDWPLW